MNFKHLLILVFFLTWVSLGLFLSTKNSPTFDEPVHVKAGNLYQQGIYDFDPIEPPLVRHLGTLFGQSLPPLLKTITLTQYRFFVILTSGILLSLLLRLYFFSKSLLLAIPLLLLEPNLVAHGHLFTTDFLSAILTFLTLLYLFQKRPKPLLLGVLIGLTVSAKIAGISFIFLGFLLNFRRFTLKDIFTICLSATIFIWTTYLFGFDQPAKSISVALPLGGFIRAIKENLQFAQRGQPLFFLEKLYQKGPYYKELIILLFKVPIPIYILAIMSLKQNFNKMKTPLIIFFISLLINLAAPLSFGTRHLLLAILSLVFLAASHVPKTKQTQALVLFLLSWQAVGFTKALPQPLTYTNLLVLDAPYHVFTDADFDWGQGLVSLGEEIKKQNITNYQFAYFGNVNPADFLPPYTRVLDANPIDQQTIEPYDPHRPLIVSATCYYLCGYYQLPQLADIKPQPIAKSFLYFYAQ